MIVAAAFSGTLLKQAVPLVKTPEELSPEKHKLLVLWGGEDISPSLYKQKNWWSNATNEPSKRDRIEKEMAVAAIEKGIPILGICRGAQLLCAINDGTLWQHVHHHAGGNHPIIFDDDTYITNSCHHQMMRPVGGEVLAYAPCLSPKKYRDYDEAVENEEEEPEIVYWSKTKSLGIQGHPEWSSPGTDLFKITKHLLKEKFSV